jgi:excisionase family DNA binding protein
VIDVLVRPRDEMATGEVVIIDSEERRRPFFTPRGLALYLSLSERTLRELLRTGEIPSYKIAGSRRIDPADVDAWLAERRHEAA